MAYFIFYIVLLALLIPLIHNLISYRNIKGEIKLPESSVYTDDDIEVHFKITNKGFLAIPFVEIENLISKELTRKDSQKTIISLEKKESYNKNEKIRLNRRGYYRLAAIRVRLKDVLGIYTFKKTISSEASLLVYPKPININHFSALSSHSSGEAYSRDSRSLNKNSIKNFREYRLGDNVGSIHWKLTAKLDTPIIKEYEHSGQTKALIVLDNYYKNYREDVDRRLEDKSVDIALSIAAYSLRESIPVSLNMQSGEKALSLEAEDSSDLKKFLEAFARLEADGSKSFSSLLDNKADTLDKNTSLILITPHLDKDLGARILDLRMGGMSIILILVTDYRNKSKPIDTDIENRLIDESVVIYIIDYDTSVKDLLEAYHD